MFYFCTINNNANFSFIVRMSREKFPAITLINCNCSRRHSAVSAGQLTALFQIVLFRHGRTRTWRCRGRGAWSATHPRLRWTSAAWRAGPPTAWARPRCPASTCWCPSGPRTRPRAAPPPTSPIPLSRYRAETVKRGGMSSSMSENYGSKSCVKIPFLVASWKMTALLFLLTWIMDYHCLGTVLPSSPLLLAPQCNGKL